MKRILFVLVAAMLVAMIVCLGIASAQDTEGTVNDAATTASSSPSTQLTDFSFNMVRSQSAVDKGCLAGASAAVAIHTVGANQHMTISLNVPQAPNTEFTVFVLQVPNAPFGVSWYQGDIDTDATGKGSETFVGIFSDETFTIAPGVAPAAQVDQFDATQNPAFKPVHGFHLGAWFARPAQAASAGCTKALTEFDGDHIAGIQALSTRQFGNNPNTGPLRRIG